MATSSPAAQTTLLIGGSNGTATLAAILGDKSNPRNANHILRVATRSTKYLDPSSSGGVGEPRVWRCTEKQHLSDLVAADIFPTRVITHVGRPDSVFVYGDDDDMNVDANNTGNGTLKLTPLERAISGISTPDNGGPVDLIVLCCPVSAHLSLLRRLAKTLYKLDALNLLGPSSATSNSSSSKPILIGTLYGAGGFDWMSRIAFTTQRPPTFSGQWTRPLALFALKAFPYLCKSLQPGEVSLHGRFPQLQVAVSPSNAYVRSHAKRLLDRLLQNETTGKKLEFLGLSGKEEVGGDGTCGDEEGLTMIESSTSYGFANHNTRSGGGGGALVVNANGARNAMMIAAQTHKQFKSAKEGTTTNGGVSSGVAPAILTNSSYSNNNFNTPPPSPTLDLLLTQSLSDHADPSSSLAFLTCTLNSTNQILHPCILVALFRDIDNQSRSDINGTIPWNPRANNGLPFPRESTDSILNFVADSFSSVC